MKIVNGKYLLEVCQKNDISIAQVIQDYEMEKTGASLFEIREKMDENLQTMEESIRLGLQGNLKGKFIGGDAAKLYCHIKENKTLSGERVAKAVAYALSVTEVNASMGKIVATPTAGACGILPGVIFSYYEANKFTWSRMRESLFTAGAVGMLIGKNASLSGAEGGCQAEVGSAAAMTAAALVEAFEGTPEQALNGAAIALKNVLGLVCDPVAGLVEVPCSKRNALGAANAIVAADLSLAGVASVIPFDEVVEAMAQVGRALPCNLKETAEGGLAATKTGIRLKNEILKED